MLGEIQMCKDFNLILILLVTALLGACADSKSGDSSELIPTVYYKPTVYRDRSKCPAKNLKNMVDVDGRILTVLCDTDFNRCLMQGSCFVHHDDKVKSFNYHSTKNSIPRFVEVNLDDCPYGYGVKNSCLDPYFSIAADLAIYNPGDVIFVPRVVGVTMPNGEVHDGFFVIRDSGGNIKGPGRFDFFTGFFHHLDRRNTLARLGFGDSKHRFEYRMAKSDEAARARENRAYPKLRSDVRQGNYQSETEHQGQVVEN